jgi:hypothetical protein
MKVTLSTTEKELIEGFKNRLLRIKKRFIKAISFKNRYQHGNYSFVRYSKWFGVIRHDVNCPNFRYQNTSLVFFKWMITDVTK